MAKQVEVKVPNIGDFDHVPVIEVLVNAGDKVEKETPLITLESEKATMEVPSPQAGTVRKLSVKEGDEVSEGSVVLLLELADDGDGDSPHDTAPAAASDAHAEDEPSNAAAEPEAPAESRAATSDTRPDATEPPGEKQRRAVTVPDIGDFDHVPVIEVLVREGDSVEEDAPLITLESDKATMEVPAPVAGIVRNLKLKEGATVSQGDAICDLETDGRVNPVESATTQPKSTSDDIGDNPSESEDKQEAEGPVTGDAPDPSTAPTPANRGKAADGVTPHASPSVRKFARELGLDLSQIRGSGPHERILREDVQDHVKQTMKRPQAATAAPGIPAIPAVDFSRFGPVERKPLGRIRKLSAAHLHRSWLNLPHVTQNDEADITDLEAFRHAQNSKRGVKLTLLPFVLKAVAHAIGDFPEFAASLDADGEHLLMKQYRHIGFAADTDHGLVVPVVRDVDRKGIVQLAKDTAELARKARDSKLSPDEMKGGVFSISSLGGIGGSHFTPIINAPEVGILGVSRAVMKPVWDGEAFQPRLMLPLSLSYDHRVIDGAYAARFIVRLVALLSDVRRLTL